MRGIPLPEPTEDFSADPSELFFDLTFVFAFSQLVSHLVHNPNWNGVGEFALLFTMIWLPWTQFTWSANAVAGNTRPARTLFLIASVASVPMAASVTTAFNDGGLTFVLALSVILSMALFTMIAGLGDAPGIRASIIRYSIPNFIAIVLLIVGALLEDGARTATWVVAISVVVIGTIRAGSSEWLVRPGHFAERHGLIVIVALGEVVVALGIPVVESLQEGAGLPGANLVALVAGGTFAGLLWWGYFDRPLPALEHRHQQHQGIMSGRFARDVYTYIHLPIVAGVILSAAALEEITVHPSDELPTAFRWMLVAGLACYLLGVVTAIARAFGAFARERLVATAALVAVVAFGGGLDAVVILIVIDVVLLATLVVEHFRVEVAFRTTPTQTVDA